MRATRSGSAALALASVLALVAGGPAWAQDPSLEFRDAWPGVTFDKPTCVAAAPDGSDRLFVALRSGKVLVVRKNRGVAPVPQPAPFVDFSASIPANLLEDSQAGLVSVACHPDFGTNGRLFVLYGTASPDGSNARTEIVEYRARGDVADPASRRLVLAVPKQQASHFGGGLVFGPDSMLYVGIGDSAKKDDPGTMGQDKRILQSKILRISPDPVGASAYGVPRDNPFATAGGGVRPEIWALGVRNPFRLSFDPAGNLWMGDPGQRGREEINVVPRGGNLGWPAKEGSQPLRPVAGVDMASLVDPVFEYGREVGKAAIGGVVYRGQRCPTLAGTYVCADYMSKKVFALALDPSGKRVTGHRILAEIEWVCSVNEDAQGELLFCVLDNDRILTVVPRS